MKLKILLPFVICILLAACQKETAEPELSDSTKEQILKKWIVPTGSNLAYSSIEFVGEEIFIVTLEDGTSLSGTYLIDTDQGIITLNGVGSLQIMSLASNTFEFKIQLLNSTPFITTICTSGMQMANSAKTELLTHNWELYKSYDNDFGVYDTTYFPETYQNSEGPVKGNIIFSKYGTYFATIINKTATGFDTSFLSRSWEWVDPNETTFKYFDDIDTGRVVIDELSRTKLNMHEGESAYFLRH